MPSPVLPDRTYVTPAWWYVDLAALVTSWAVIIGSSAVLVALVRLRIRRGPGTTPPAEAMGDPAGAVVTDATRRPTGPVVDLVAGQMEEATDAPGGRVATVVGGATTTADTAARPHRRYDPRSALGLAAIVVDTGAAAVAAIGGELVRSVAHLPRGSSDDEYHDEHRGADRHGVVVDEHRQRRHARHRRVLVFPDLDRRPGTGT